ncbi:MAG: hypothetical protein NTV63_04975 [Candidatus Woesearchaeota archaeon]|nr:hypothetical protein [Candidatus Woesearchaeota archaeon]
MLNYDRRMIEEIKKSNLRVHCDEKCRGKMGIVLDLFLVLVLIGIVIFLKNFIKMI